MAKGIGLIPSKSSGKSGRKFKNLPSIKSPLDEAPTHFVPPGVYGSDELIAGGQNNIMGTIDARVELERFLPRLNLARTSGDIFAYSAALQDLKAARAKRIGEDLPLEAPDEMEIEKNVRRRAMRRRNRGRQSTILTDTLGPSSAGL